MTEEKTLAVDQQAPRDAVPPWKRWGAAFGAVAAIALGATTVAMIDVAYLKIGQDGITYRQDSHIAVAVYDTATGTRGDWQEGKGQDTVVIPLSNSGIITMQKESKIKIGIKNNSPFDTVVPLLKIRTTPYGSELSSNQQQFMENLSLILETQASKPRIDKSIIQWRDQGHELAQLEPGQEIAVDMVLSMKNKADTDVADGTKLNLALAVEAHANFA